MFPVRDTADLRTAKRRRVARKAVRARSHGSRNIEKAAHCAAFFLCPKTPCRSGGSREPLLPPLRRQGGLGRGAVWIIAIRDHSPPELPLPSLGEEQSFPAQIGRAQVWERVGQYV